MHNLSYYSKLALILLSYSINSWSYENFFWVKSNPENVGIKKEEFKKFIDFTMNDKNRHRTNSLLVIKDNRLIFEGYNRGFRQDTRQIMWSASKTFAAVLVGLAIDKGILERESLIADFYPIAGADQFTKKLQVSHLLNMSSGLDWNESYLPTPKSKVIQMLYSKGKPTQDMALFTSQSKQKFAPGSVFKYSSGETNLMLGVLKKALGPKYESWPQEQLYKPLGITSAFWEQDESGNYVGSSYLHMSARDAARFGLLLLNKGKWQGQTLLSEKFFNYMITQAPAFAKTNLKGSGKPNRRGHGAHIWLNIDQKEKGLKREFTNAPASLYMALGVQGQMIAMLPEQNMVIVRLGRDKSGWMDRNKFFKLLMNSIEDKK